MLIAAPIVVAMAVAVWRSRSCGLNNLYVISGVRVAAIAADVAAMHRSIPFWVMNLARGIVVKSG